MISFLFLASYPLHVLVPTQLGLFHTALLIACLLHTTYVLQLGPHYSLRIASALNQHQHQIDFILPEGYRATSCARNHGPQETLQH